MIGEGLSLKIGGARGALQSARIWRRQLSTTWEVVMTDDDAELLGGVEGALFLLL